MAINAMHAMPRGGEVVIRTSLEEVDAARAAAWEVRAGPHARLDFEDDGEGMPPEVADRVFEPFFSTKGKDGTGLGMSEVYAMVRRRGGFMRCESQLGVGTRFQIFLPSRQLEVRPEAPASRAEPASPPAGGEGRVLVVDDDPLVARTAARVLGREGYVVEQASTGEEALERVLSAGGIDAVVSDVVMPGMGGLALRQALRERAPTVPVLLVSGFSDRAAREHAGVDILRKPYAPTELLRRVAELLARQAASTSSDCPEGEPRTPGEGPRSPSVSEEARNCS
jgi:CheY-like chemotaxis protein